MQETNDMAAQTSRYDMVAMILHWVTALLLVFMLVFGEELMEAGEEAEELGRGLAGTFGPSLHVSIGSAILILTLLRILWRLTHRAPPYPATMKPHQVLAARAVHGLFYLLLVGIPLTGWLAFGGLVAEEPAMAAVRVFGAFPVPAAPVAFGAAKELHEIGSNAAIALAVLHVLAALKHQFVDGDGVFRRMLPL
jgi:cytochrome b561